jgi:hypothetical protein
LYILKYSQSTAYSRCVQPVTYMVVKVRGVVPNTFSMAHD